LSQTIYRESEPRIRVAASAGSIYTAFLAWLLIVGLLISLPEIRLIGGASHEAFDWVTAALARFSQAQTRQAFAVSVPTAPASARALPVSAPTSKPASAPRAVGAPATGVAGGATLASVATPAGAAAPVVGPGVAPPPSRPSAAAAAPTAQPQSGGPTGPVRTFAPTAAPIVAPTAAATVAPTVAPTVPLSLTVQGPRPPGAYVVPAGAVAVDTSAELITALQRSASADIVLADGVYDNGAPFANPNGHRLYAEHLLGATLKAGLTMSTNYGLPNGIVRGIAFDVADPNKTFEGNIIFIWGPQQYGVQVLDSTFRGHGAIGSAIWARQMEGLVIRRVVVRDFTDWGVLADNNNKTTVLRTPPKLEDLDVANVSRAVPKSAAGTAEACIGLGNTGTLRRVKVRNCAWMGVTTFDASRGSLLEDLDIDGTATGVYIEHFTSNSVFQRMHIGPNVEDGVTCEGTDPAGAEWGGTSASIDNVIQDSVIDSTHVGVLMGWTTTRTNVRRVTFRNQYVAAITDYKGVDNSYSANDYSGIQTGALAVSPVWWRR
jgi:hypothetical protein